MRMFPDFLPVFYDDSPHGVAEALSHSLPPGARMDFGGSAPNTSQYYTTAVNQANQLQEQQFQQTQQELQPWLGAGTGAVNLLGGILNVPGYGSIDPTKTLEATPGYNFLMSQGVAARDASAAANGNLLSGAQQKGLTTFGQGIADQTYQQYLGNLFGLSGSGQQAANTTGQLGANMANNVGQNYLTLAQAQAQNALQQYQAQQASKQSGYNVLGGLIGTGAAVAAAPFTGGTSLIGAGINALSSGGGGGYGGDAGTGSIGDAWSSGG